MAIKKIIVNIVDYINKNLSIYFFNNANLFSYNVFSIFYKLKICGNNKNENYFKTFYSNLGFVNSDSLDEINKDLELQRKNNNETLTKYSMSENIKLNIKKIVNNDLDKHLSNFEIYYNTRVCLAWAGISRNYPIERNNDEESYSNFYHNDAYIFTLFKFFINLHDVDLEQGPMHVVKKKESKKFIRFHNYKKRNNYLKSDKTPENYIHVNIGKKGEIFFCNTTELLHKAGEPKKKNLGICYF